VLVALSYCPRGGWGGGSAGVEGGRVEEPKMKKKTDVGAGRRVPGVG